MNTSKTEEKFKSAKNPPDEGFSFSEAVSTVSRSLFHWFPYIYLVLAGSFVLLLSFVQPPFEGPDEPHHFFRAIQVSYLDLTPQLNAGSTAAGAWLPDAANTFAARELSHQIRYGFTPNAWTRFSRIRADGIRLIPAKPWCFIEFTDESIYPPVYYLPQAAALRLARFFSNKMFVWFFTGRLINGLTAVLLVWIALLLSRPQQIILATAALLPMSLGQMASLSPDAWLIGGTILFVNLCLRLRERPSRAAEVFCLLWGIWLLLVRPVLFPGVLIAPVFAYWNSDRRRGILLSAITAVVSAALYFAWSRETAPAMALLVRHWHGDEAMQIQYIETRPLAFIQMLLSTLKVAGSGLFLSFVGILGWLRVQMPGRYYEFAKMALFVLVVISLMARRVFSWVGITTLLAMAAMIGAVCTVIYLLFTPPGADMIVGLQGRYFIPVFAFVALLCGLPRKDWEERFLAGGMLCLMFVGVTLPATARALTDRFYRPRATGTHVPQGNIDSPAPETVVGDHFVIYGWAACLDKIDHVSIFVDGHFVQSLQPNVERPDVDDAMPDSPDEMKGWTISEDASKLPHGEHSLVAHAVTSDGRDVVIGTVPFRH